VRRERGGAVADILIFIGAIVVIAGFAGVACGACASGASPARTSAPVLQRRDCNDRDQDCRDQNHRGNFSPGPFEDSPVDAFNNNTVCLPGSTCYAGTTTTTRGGG
jgi:hypothetical protein